MEYHSWGRVENTIIQGACTIDANSEYCVWRNISLAGGSSITDNGAATHLEYRDKSYTDYNFIYSTGAAQAQGARLRANGSSVSLTNLFNNQFIQIPAFSAEAVLGASNWRSSADNVHSLGTASNKWSVVYAGTGTINTSDERQKQDIKELSDAERQVAIAIKGLIKSFKFKDAVAKKGDKARIHFGVMAQQVAEAFKIVGLNPDDYALFCYDKWDAVEEVVDDKGEIIVEAREAGDSYGVRYEELLAFVISAL
jgi:hypothetical protein